MLSKKNRVYALATPPVMFLLRSIIQCTYATVLGYIVQLACKRPR